MKNANSKSLLVFFAALFFAGALFVSRDVLAAEFKLSGEFAVGIDQSFEVPVVLDAKDEKINVISGEISFPDELLKATAIHSGDSIVSFWIDEPKAIDGKIVFSGIIPGSFDGNRGPVFSMTFKAVREGKGGIAFVQSLALLGDGKGTPVLSSGNTAQVTVSGAAKQSQAETKAVDTNPPESFRPEISSVPDIFGGDYFVAFYAQDKGSGISHYEVQEVVGGKVNSSPWQRAESPHRLSDQSLKSLIRVKAIDYSGNERIEDLLPTNSDQGYRDAIKWSIIFLSVFFIVIFAAWTIARRKR